MVPIHAVLTAMVIAQVSRELQSWESIAPRLMIAKTPPMGWNVPTADVAFLLALCAFIH